MLHVTSRHFAVPAGFACAATFPGCFLAAAVLAVAQPPAPVGISAILSVGALTCVDVSRRTAGAIGVMTWAFVTGFVVNDAGVLAVTGPADLWRLTLCLGMPLIVATATSGHRAARCSRSARH